MEPIVVILLVIGVLGFQFVRIWRQERALQRSPVVQVPARVITTYFRRRYPLSPGRRLTYHVIFELKTGDRKTFAIEGQVLAEGTSGILTYQGQQFLNFQY